MVNLGYYTILKIQFNFKWWYKGCISCYNLQNMKENNKANTKFRKLCFVTWTFGGKITAPLLSSICTNRVLVEFSLLVENDSVFMVKILHSFHSIIHNRNFFYYNLRIYSLDNLKLKLIWLHMLSMISWQFYTPNLISRFSLKMENKWQIEDYG
ncbi:hypothetical protein BpHYR1_042788 [Brachionus plicatilis]|uniref:Uncharacterized protein n=1 Tax=Brachionus plicatilis TaxID=10195 RepID=A0A3M7PCT9_BRAPC|nr:hypothetical protein BpHYR1_042788 [Brachionus plicatilis]